jgi:deoxycytidine triphosphate deaminase
MQHNQTSAPRMPTGTYRRSQDFNVKSLLSRPAILRMMCLNEILISPFNQKNLGTNSYDVTLGPHYWTEDNPERTHNSGNGLTKYGPETIYNPYDEEHVRKLWRKQEALPWRELQFNAAKHQLRHIEPDDKVILIRPGEAILGHTMEFIGGSGNRVTTMMKARSSV